MKWICFVYFIFFSCGVTPYQNNEFIKYINSFKLIKSSDIYNFGELSESGDKMSKKEAIKFVYDGDSSKLYCKQRMVNNETEKFEGFVTEEYMPIKCLRFDLNNYYLITYVSYECSNPNELVKGLLHLAIIDKKYNVTDNTIVYIGDEYDWVKTGIINPANGRFFIIAQQSENNSKSAFIYKVNSSLQFELVKEAEKVSGTTDDMDEALTILKWNNFFYD
jgi:hypothetical protein